MSNTSQSQWRRPQPCRHPSRNFSRSAGLPLCIHQSCYLRKPQYRVHLSGSSAKAAQGGKLFAKQREVASSSLGGDKGEPLNVSRTSDQDETIRLHLYNDSCHLKHMQSNKVEPKCWWYYCMEMLKSKWREIITKKKLFTSLKLKQQQLFGSV